MIKTEAKWIRQQLEWLALPVMNLGSSTLEFRTTEQPWISECLAGFMVTHVDAKEAVGVDLVRVIGRDSLPGAALHVVLMSSLLEHVEDREAALLHVSAMRAPALIITVPHVWPHHPDPIDNGYRPSVAELVTDVCGVISYGCVSAAECHDPRGSCSCALFRRFD